MKKAIEKILNNFVFGDSNISHYDIDYYPTPEAFLTHYVVEIYTPLDISMDEAQGLLDRLQTALNMLGFTYVDGNMFNDANKDKLLIRAHGKIKE
jgi:hypothetical protein